MEADGSDHYYQALEMDGGQHRYELPVEEPAVEASGTPILESGDGVHSND